MSNPLGFEPITLDELRELGRRIDSEYIFADSVEDMYRQVNENYGTDKWCTLRGPVVDKNGQIVLLLIKPREE